MTQPALQLDLTSDPAEIAGARKAVEAVAVASGFDDRATYDIGLCVNEAIANIIRHAYDNVRGRPIHLTAEMIQQADGDALHDTPHDTPHDALHVTLRDWGNGRMPDFCNVATPDPDDILTRRPGGLGLPCLKRLLDDVQFHPQPDGMRLRLTKIKR